MKLKNIITMITLFGMGSLFLSLGACNKQKDLTTEEIADLKFLREEEKLARDVYLYAFDIYNEDIFNSIAGSEQNHMNQMLSILNNYDIEDPATEERGVFNNIELQALYDQLIVKTDSSLLDALIVGATIEDVDIYDIDEFLSRTDKDEIITVYNNLECGSNNHMRSFVAQLNSLDYDYVPQYISLEHFNLILAEENGGCNE